MAMASDSGAGGTAKAGAFFQFFANVEHAKALQIAAFQCDHDGVTAAFNRLRLVDELSYDLTLSTLLHVCEVLWNEFLWTEFGCELLNTLVSFCERLQRQGSHQKLWTAYNLYLTTIAIRQRGYSAVVAKLRELNSGMNLCQMVTCKATDLTTEVHCVPFVRCGLALQAHLDVEGGTHIRILDVISQASGLLRTEVWQFYREWVVLVSKAFENCSLEEFKSGDNSKKALELVKTNFEVQNHFRPGVSAFLLQCTVLKSLSFLGAVKALRDLIAGGEASIEFFITADAVLLNKFKLADDETDAEAFEELKNLVRALYLSEKIYFEQEDIEHVARRRMHMVLRAVNVYMRVILLVGRGETKHKELLEPGELRLAKAWLLRLRDEAAVLAEKQKGALQLDYEGKVKTALDLALLMVRNPVGYKYGIPVF